MKKKKIYTVSEFSLSMTVNHDIMKLSFQHILCAKICKGFFFFYNFKADSAHKFQCLCACITEPQLRLLRGSAEQAPTRSHSTHSCLCLCVCLCNHMHSLFKGRWSRPGHHIFLILSYIWVTGLIQSIGCNVCVSSITGESVHP